MNDDAQLLRAYAEEGSEPAFAELVQRHLNLVYSAALRQVNGDAHLAADVTQIVFSDLARKAAVVAQHRVLAGWLFTSTRYAASKAVRGEQRRRARELEAHVMQELSRDSDPHLDWERVRPVLDEALGDLSAADREAILLRYFEGREFADIGARLRLNANTARMRVERALDKLNARLTRNGVTSTAAALAAALMQQGIAAAPAGLASTVTGAALAGGAAGGTAAAVTAIFMSTKLHVGAAAALVAAAATGVAVQRHENATLHQEVAALRQQSETSTALRRENARLAALAAEAVELKRDDEELARLRDEAAALATKLKKTAATSARMVARAPLEGPVFDIKALDRQPTPSFQARPQYPFELRRTGTGGEVVVEFVVDANGEVREARAVRSGVKGEKLETSDGVVKMAPFAIHSAQASGGADGSVSKIDGIPVADAAKLLETSAVEAVSKWKFKAGQKGGAPVNTRMQIPIVFVMEKESKPADIWF